mmetsp:Transcript_7914/g.26082  ORF Transcript_7914/g.26082 Transcript_7914/m.26082 type:complete len:207 (-) Transcript_7914:265-885(-)
MRCCARPSPVRSLRLVRRAGGHDQGGLLGLFRALLCALLLRELLRLGLVGRAVVPRPRRRHRLHLLVPGRARAREGHAQPHQHNLGERGLDGEGALRHAALQVDVMHVQLADVYPRQQQSGGHVEAPHERSDPTSDAAAAARRRLLLLHDQLSTIAETWRWRWRVVARAIDRAHEFDEPPDGPVDIVAGRCEAGRVVRREEEVEFL